MQKMSRRIKNRAILISLLSLIAAPVFSADIGTKVPQAPVTIQALSSWTGFYVGGGLGYTGIKNVHTNSNDRILRFPPLEKTPNGFLLSALVGYDFQLSNNILIGAFADFDLSNAKGKWQDFSGGNTVFGDLKQSWQWSLGTRLGYIVNPSLMIYGNTGFTQSNFDKVDFSLNDGTTVNRTLPATTFNGYFVGLGLEQKLNSNWTTRVEYRYSDFSARKIDRFNPLTSAFSTETDQKVNQQAVKLNLVYKFN